MVEIEPLSSEAKQETKEEMEKTRAEEQLPEAQHTIRENVTGQQHIQDVPDMTKTPDSLHSPSYPPRYKEKSAKNITGDIPNMTKTPDSL